MAGTVACNLSGPRRFKSGALRDHLLGFAAINGKGESIQSGGTVVKNVTGYDLSKLLAGSYGTLSVLTEVILKVTPEPEHSETLIIHGQSFENASKIFSQVLKTSLEISGACYYPSNNIKFLRLNDVKNTSSVTALRIEGPKQSVNERIQNLQKIFSEYNDQTVLEVYQSNLFWKITANLDCFSNSPQSHCKNFITSISYF